MDTTTNEKFWIIAWAAVQGVALLLLHSWSALLDEPAHVFWLLWPSYTVAAWLPLSMQLLAQHRREVYLWRLLGAFIAALAVMSAYKGWVAWTPNMAESSYWSGSAAVFGLTAATLWFVLLPFAQMRLHNGVWKADYPFLFAAAWRNIMQLASAVAFTGVLWLLLWLWAGLFAVLGVKFFAALFSSRFFVYPVSSIAFGLGLFLYRSHETAMHGIYCTLLRIMGWLLPLAALLAVCFLTALPFTGLQPLWKTGHAGALLLTLQGFLLLLFNAAWQDGGGEPLPPRWLRRPLAWAIALLPLYAGLNAYSLGLRIAQYGWSGERVWAALLIFICGFYGLGYAYAALRRSAVWMAGVAQVNIAGALLLAGLLAATATPLLAPERIGVASQVGRLLSEKVKADAFDYRYLRFDAGRYGTAALERLAALDGHPQAAEIRKRAAAAQTQKIRYGENTRADWTAEEIAAQIAVYPQGAMTEPSFLPFLAAKANAEPWSYDCLQRNKRACLLLVVDMNDDGNTEHILIANAYSGEIYRRNGKDWSRVGDLILQSGDSSDFEAMKRDLASGKLHVLEPEWRDIEIGARRYGMRR